MSDAFLLGVDTSRDGDLVLAQLSASGELTLLAQQTFSAREQSAELLPRLHQLLADTHVSLRQLGAIVVVHGPGSFTGLRVGLAAVKGLAHATGIPVIAISSLAVLASLQPNATVSALIAGRSEYYVRGRGQDGLIIESLQSDTDLSATIASAPSIAAENALAGRFAQTPAPVTLFTFGAFDAIRASLPRFHAKDFADISTLDANYVRRPYTERESPAHSSSNPAVSG